MATSLISSILTAAGIGTIFSIYNESTGVPILRGLKVHSVDIGSDAAVTDQPISNQQLSDSSVYIALQEGDLNSAKIMRPSRLRLNALVDDISMTGAILSLFNDVQSTVRIVSKSIISESMALVNVSISQDADMVSASRFVMEFEQSVPPVKSTYNPLQAADSSSFGVNVQQPQTITQSVGDLYTKVSSFF